MDDTSKDSQTAEAPGVPPVGKKSITVMDGAEIKPDPKPMEAEKTPEPPVAQESAAPVIGSSMDTSPDTPEPTQSDKSTAAKPHEGLKKVLVIVIVLVAFGAIGGAVYLYTKKSKKTTTVQNTVSQVKTETPAKTSDVDQTTKDVDDAVKKTDDTKDVSSSDLTDSALGL